jgi:bacteriocin biosynthesis cyclodehydratase domain-containing protein
MVLRLDPRFAVVWRDPFSLQLGVDPARVVLREVTAAEERMIDALGSGISRSGLDMIATSNGATVQDVTSLLEGLEPLLLPQPIPTQDAVPFRVSIVGRGPTVDRIATGLTLAGVQVSVSRAVSDGMSDDPCDLGIAVGHYVLDPESYGFWLRRDLPHLPVLFGDDSVMIGPVVDGGRTACLYCLEHFRRDSDASWSAIASQLWGRRTRSETPLVSGEVSALVIRLVLKRLAAGRPTGGPLSARSFRLAVETGDLTRREWMPHPECGCAAVPSGFRDGVFGNGGSGNGGSAETRFSAGQPESGSPADLDPPTKAAAAVGRA